MNQALAFGLLLAGGIALEAGLTGKGPGAVLLGTAGAIPKSGTTLAITAATPGAAAAATATTGAVGAVGSTIAGYLNNGSKYTNPLQGVTNWERTDQGVDANMPVGAPIKAPSDVKILGIEPNWYNGQPFIYWQLLDGPDKGKVQYVAEQITDLATVGSIVKEGDPIAKYAASGTGLEFGWATSSGQTLAMATTGYTEGYATTAGKDVRNWLNALGAGAGTGAGLSIGAGADPDDAAAAIAHQAAAVKRDVTTPGYVYHGAGYKAPKDDDDD